MALTQQQAQQAGVIANQLVVLQTGAAQAQAAVAGAAMIEDLSATVVVNGTRQTIALAYEINATDTATLLNSLGSILQNYITALNSQLAAL